MIYFTAVLALCVQGSPARAQSFEEAVGKGLVLTQAVEKAESPLKVEVKEKHDEHDGHDHAEKGPAAVDVLWERVHQAEHKAEFWEVRRLLFVEINRTSEDVEVLGDLIWYMGKTSTVDKKQGKDHLRYAKSDFVEFGGLKPELLAIAEDAKQGYYEKATALFEWAAAVNSASPDYFQLYGTYSTYSAGYKQETTDKAEAMKSYERAIKKFDEAIRLTQAGKKTEENKTVFLADTYRSRANACRQLGGLAPDKKDALLKMEVESYNAILELPRVPEEEDKSGSVRKCKTFALTRLGEMGKLP